MPVKAPLIDFLIPQFQDWRIIDAISSIIDHPEASRFRIVVLDGGRDAALHDRVATILRAGDVHRVALDRGIYDALNAGLALATAEWVGWIGSDDLLSSSFSTAPLDRAANSTHFVSYVTLFFRAVDGVVTRVYQPVRSRLLRRNGFHLPHFSTFIRTAAVQTMTFDIAQKNFADQLFMDELESRFAGSVSDNVATLMCEGGLSNSSWLGVIKTNLDVAKAVRGKRGYVGSVIYVGLKLMYKSAQRVAALGRPRNIAAYRGSGGRA